MARLALVVALLTAACEDPPAQQCYALDMRDGRRVLRGLGMSTNPTFEVESSVDAIKLIEHLHLRVCGAYGERVALPAVDAGEADAGNQDSPGAVQRAPTNKASANPEDRQYRELRQGKLDAGTRAWR